MHSAICSRAIPVNSPNQNPVLPPFLPLTLNHQLPHHKFATGPPRVTLPLVCSPSK
ncbi:hypothetical protein HanPSC8_Chr17g0751721 [Helianthus annuus]|nr:hypothetical protein HanPSC8_Chr17g0751721 [Helianthus annuus]